MNYVRLLGKLGLYQQKVFIHQLFQLDGSGKTSDKLYSLYMGKYLFLWHFSFLIQLNYFIYHLRYSVFNIFQK